MCTVWHVDKYKITLISYKFQENLSRPGIIDARAWYRAAARRLRNAGLRSRSAADRLLRSCVRFPPGAWMSVCWERCVLQVEVSATS